MNIWCLCPLVLLKADIDITIGIARVGNTSNSLSSPCLPIVAALSQGREYATSKKVVREEALVTLGNVNSRYGSPVLSSTRYCIDSLQNSTRLDISQSWDNPEALAMCLAIELPWAAK